MKTLLTTIVSLSRVLITAFAITLTGCSKQDKWLDAKRNNTDVTPKTLKDFQAVLDNNQVMNGYSSIIGLVGTDNVYVPDNYLDAADQTSRNAYLWNKDIYQSAIAGDWQYPYQVVEYSNIVLDGLQKIQVQDQQQFNNVKGSALFYRAFAFYELAQLYCKDFVSNTAGSDLGIPVRLTSDVNVRTGRANVQDTYDQIIADLKEATGLLPKTPAYKTRPSSVAAKALLAKVYFAMGDYGNAKLSADQALNDNSDLLNFSTLTIGSANPFPTLAKGNPEVIFHAWGISYSLTSQSGRARIQPALYQTYQNGDLRKTAFFTADGTTGLFRFKGSYSANQTYFCGISTNEIYLVRAECLARMGNMVASLDDLNKLLKNRYTSSTFTAIQVADRDQLINIIIQERRKELPFTGHVRWEDLRRLNRLTNTQVTLTRTYKGMNYTLAPNDARYVFPIPDDEIQLNNLTQNIR